MDAESILVLLNELPKYISLIYPGYITMYLFFFFSGKELKDTSWIIAKAVFISYVYGVLCREILNRMNYNSEAIFNIILMIVAIAIGYFAARIRDAKRFNSFLNRIKGDTSFLEDEFELLRDADRSAWVCVYLRNSKIVYEGSLREANLHSRDRKYICLSGYRKYIVNDDGHPKIPYIVDEAGNNEEKTIIYYDDIALMEKRDTAS